ncbi:MAG: hypothetical protein ACK55Z_18380, partial [bacterium]
SLLLCRRLLRRRCLRLLRTSPRGSDSPRVHAKAPYQSSCEACGSRCGLSSMGHCAAGVSEQYCPAGWQGSHRRD